MNIENIANNIYGEDHGFALGDIDDHYEGVAEDVKEYGVYNDKQGAVDIYNKDAILLRDEYIRQFKNVDLTGYDFAGKLEEGRVKGYVKLEELFEQQ